MKQTRNRCRKRHRMRCKKKECGARVTLKKHPDEYVRPHQCPRCGRMTLRSVEEERRREIAKVRCTCAAYPFPHARGKMRFCHFHPLAAVQPTIDEFEQYEACLATPRSG